MAHWEMNPTAAIWSVCLEKKITKCIFPPATINKLNQEVMQGTDRGNRAVQHLNSPCEARKCRRYGQKGRFFRRCKFMEKWEKLIVMNNGAGTTLLMGSKHWRYRPIQWDMIWFSVPDVRRTTKSYGLTSLTSSATKHPRKHNVYE
jgi:hypothetical protein